MKILEKVRENGLDEDKDEDFDEGGRHGLKIKFLKVRMKILMNFNYFFKFRIF